jgi:hypothetical protein
MDMLGRLDVLNRHAIIEFIYNLQISINPECRYSSQSGFIGSTFLGSGFQFNCSENENNECNCCDFFHSYVQVTLYISLLRAVCIILKTISIPESHSHVLHVYHDITNFKRRSLKNQQIRTYSR